jgi:hypothetical protein
VNAPAGRRTGLARNAWETALPAANEPPSPPAVRLVAIDLDGTLLDSAGRVPARTRAALHRAHEGGLKIVLCTGRAYTETRSVITQIGLDLDATVTIGGALLTDVGADRTISRIAFDPALAGEVLAWFAQRGQTVIWTHDRHAHGFDGFVIAGPRRHAAVDQWVTRTVCKLRPPPADLLTTYDALRFSIIDEPGELDRLARDYIAAFGGRVSQNVIHVPAYDFTVLETFAGSVDKWTGIVRLCRHWDIDPAATAAIGDDVNDLPMIRQAGLGVAIGNARPEVRAAARRVVASNDDCGVAELLDALAPPPRDPRSVS